MIKELLLFFMLSFCSWTYCQTDCYLGIGGRDDETIVKVFKLDSIQIKKMKDWGAELKYRNSFLIDQADNLLERHAESSPKVLMTMSYQYKEILDSMQGNLRMVDKRMLGIFNEEQYNLYFMLCNEIVTIPLYPATTVNEK